MTETHCLSPMLMGHDSRAHDCCFSIAGRMVLALPPSSVFVAAFKDDLQVIWRGKSSLLKSQTEIRRINYIIKDSFGIQDVALFQCGLHSSPLAKSSPPLVTYISVLNNIAWCQPSQPVCQTLQIWCRKSEKVTVSLLPFRWFNPANIAASSAGRHHHVTTIVGLLFIDQIYLK